MEKNPELRKSLDCALANLDQAIFSLNVVHEPLTAAGMTQEAAGIGRQIANLGCLRIKMSRTYAELCKLEGLTP
jgi:hypothetical protein